MNTTLTSRIELFFWNFAIQALSHSQIMRSVLPRVHRLMSISPVVSVALLMGLSGAVGLFSGLVFFYVSVALR